MRVPMFRTRAVSIAIVLLSPVIILTYKVVKIRNKMQRDVSRWHFRFNIRYKNSIWAVYILYGLFKISSGNLSIRSIFWGKKFSIGGQLCSTYTCVRIGIEVQVQGGQRIHNSCMCSLASMTKCTRTKEKYIRCRENCGADLDRSEERRVGKECRL